MAIEKDETRGGHVKLVISRATWGQLCAMADVERHEQFQGNGQIVPLVIPRGYRSEPTFWVCAAMLLGNADAMMLAQISQPCMDEFHGGIRFDGLELF